MTTHEQYTEAPVVSHLSDRDIDNRVRYYQASNAFLRNEIERLHRLIEQLELELEKSEPREAV